MKSSLLLATTAVAAFATSAHAQDGSFSAVDKALWIDRHNYFRMTALPWSAGNMLRMKWSEELAGAAIAAAKGCTVTSGAGINAFTQSTSGASAPVIDAAMNSWAENGAYEALAEIKAPGKDGVGVGIGVYNSYSQIVWAATNQVGCGYAACTTGKHVVCKYAVPGNKAGEPWYVHAQPDTMCPAGTKGMQGLCVVPDDPGNADIAPIPAGQHAYEVFEGFIGDIRAILADLADSGPMTGGAGGSTNPGKAANGGPMTGGAGGSTNPGKAGDGGPMTGGAGGSTNPGTTAAPGTAATTAPTGDASTTTTAPSPAMTDATGTKSPSKTTTDGSGESSAAGATDKSNGDTAAKSIDFGSLMNTTGDKPGTVNAGSHSGTAFSNATPSEATTSGAAASPSTAPRSASKKSASASELSDTSGGSGTANNKSDSGKDGDGAGFSAAGVAGAIVVGCVMVAGVFVFVSYRKNQQRQRDIMQNGGIHVL